MLGQLVDVELRADRTLVSFLSMTVIFKPTTPSFANGAGSTGA